MQTERLTLEPLSSRHAAELLAYHERNRGHFKPWDPDRDDAFYTLAFQQAIAASAEAEFASGAGARFLAFEHGGSQIVASVNLSNVRRGVIHAGIVGYSVDEAYQGRGYATEAVGAVVRYGFDVLNLHRVEASYQPTNERSGRVLRKLGFVVEGYARDYLFLSGAWRDGILVSLTNRGWHHPG